VSGSKLSKKEQRRQQVARDKRSRNLKIIIPLAIIGILLVGYAIYRTAQPEVEGVTEVVSAAGADHDNSLEIDFGGLPPLGGTHWTSWQNCGIYLDPVLPQRAIHSMEHGAVWITYQPDLPEDEVALLHDAVEGYPETIVSPYPDQEAPVVLTVWNRQLTVDSAADERVDEFISRYYNRSGPEASASCVQGGFGTPDG